MSAPEKKVPAIPPNDYTGSISDWMVGLVQRGHLGVDTGEVFYGDIRLTVSEYQKLLEECES